MKLSVPNLLRLFGAACIILGSICCICLQKSFLRSSYLSYGRLFLSAVMTEVYSWGNGANYQLGTGTAGIQRIPCRLDTLQNLDITYVAAAKFHSAAVTANGDMYTWGFGRGGRLGHPDFDIHRFASCFL